MKVAKWGNSLAVGLPKKVVEELGLVAGDDIHLIPSVDRRIVIHKTDDRERALQAISEARWTLPTHYKFDRQEANER